MIILLICDNTSYGEQNKNINKIVVPKNEKYTIVQILIVWKEGCKA